MATLGKCPNEHDRMMLEAAIEKARSENNLMLQANMVKARNESLNRCNVLCRVGFGPSVILCSLTAGKNDYFSVDGPHSVHLTGYYRDKRKPIEDGKRVCLIFYYASDRSSRSCKVVIYGAHHWRSCSNKRYCSKTWMSTYY
ncbi:hypothetical protein MKW98_029709 [Papaver atlanticum]|uniref:Uncharacterized protein n=1 Tax=Papaver atlanticum TaxID=357466 RepID=A0AAD4T6W0_9MAGN|nr:hypothetical protein MKW98_029709 [Papaver atlanticum]